MSGRDPELVGWGTLAYYALEADEAPDAFYRAAVGIQRDLQELSARLAGMGDQEGSQAVVDALLFAVTMAELLDDDGNSEIAATVGYRKPGKPPVLSKMERARRGRRAAIQVERLVAEGWKQEAAIHQISAESGLCRSELFAWLKSNRAILSLRKSTNSTD